MTTQTKRVHWAATEQTFPISRTPSPSWSDNSLPESSAPYTPPSPFKSAPLSPNGIIEMNPLLAYNPYTRTSPIVYDVSQRPATARLRAKELAQPVTYPPLYSMEVQITHLPFWRPIQLAATSPQAGVTLAELLDAVHAFLQLSVTGKEYASFPPDVRNSISLAFARRCERAGAGAEAEKKKGLKRVDCLLGNFRWIGLTRAGKGSQSWQLHLAPISR